MENLWIVLIVLIVALVVLYAIFKFHRLIVHADHKGFHLEGEKDSDIKTPGIANDRQLRNKDRERQPTGNDR